MQSKDSVLKLRKALDEFSQSTDLIFLSDDEVKSLYRAMAKANKGIVIERDRNNRGLPSRKYADMDWED